MNVIQTQNWTGSCSSNTYNEFQLRSNLHIVFASVWNCDLSSTLLSVLLCSVQAYTCTRFHAEVYATWGESNTTEIRCNYMPPFCTMITPHSRVWSGLDWEWLWIINVIIMKELTNSWVDTTATLSLQLQSTEERFDYAKQIKQVTEELQKVSMCSSPLPYIAHKVNHSHWVVV